MWGLVALEACSVEALYSLDIWLYVDGLVLVFCLRGGAGLEGSRLPPLAR